MCEINGQKEPYLRSSAKICGQKDLIYVNLRAKKAAPLCGPLAGNNAQGFWQQAEAGGEVADVFSIQFDGHGAVAF